MKKSSEDMLGLVNALLEVYRYESGKLFLCKTHFSLEELIKETAKKLSPLLVEDNLNFEFNFPNNNRGETIINADKNEIRRVISNLLGNAIKHSKKDGNIKINVTCENKDAKVDIVDFGEGLSKEDIDKLFNRFSQGTSKKRSTSTGLGLYLSRQIIEAHNNETPGGCTGSIYAKGELDKGCTFSFILKNSIIENKVSV
jgi:signal transduction histidine kinase